MKRWLFTSTDNSPLIIFRIIFGFLILCESWGAIATGWVNRILIAPKFTFHFIGLDFLQPLPGYGMYFYFGLMGLFGIGIILGYRYLISIIGFTILWSGVYFMQKSAYNNHYYLLWLINILMCVLPANKDLSLDVKYQHTSKSNSMPNWCRFLIIAQLAIVYTFASVAKWYPDWINGSVAKQLMASKANYPIVGALLQKESIHYIIAYVGILFDLLIIPALLYKPTRKIAFSLALFFHLYNSIVFQIGIFPYLALGFTVFFFPASTIRKLFYPTGEKNAATHHHTFTPSNRILLFLGIWLFIQTALPLRHWFFEGDVLYTEEGHRLSWRMMLRSKYGHNTFFIKEKGQINRTQADLDDYLTPKQIRSMSGKPDLIWQFAQHLKKEYCKKGKEIEVYVSNWTYVNQSPSFQLIDPTVDLASVKWDHFSHSDWILYPKKNN